ncbi:MAG: PD-(D/E)XK nuclease family protein, partial [Clostridia bacterium]|nr:PD-(D/E)XK nuclease family protein [Clostridia bacterium]
DNDKILRAINHIKTLILPNDIVLKEQQFLSYMPADRLIKTDKQNKILVQGVADLIIIKNDEIYLIDYKTSRIKDVKLFKEKYATQLDIYAKAIESFYEKPVTKKMIYSFYLDELVII